MFLLKITLIRAVLRAHFALFIATLALFPITTAVIVLILVRGAVTVDLLPVVVGLMLMLLLSVELLDIDVVLADLNHFVGEVVTVLVVRAWVVRCVVHLVDKVAVHVVTAASVHYLKFNYFN